MVKDEHKAIIEKGGFLYWEDFFKDRRGNPWTVRPSLTMLEDYQIFYMSKKNAITHAIEAGEVFFDTFYIEAWKKHHLEGLDFLFPVTSNKKKVLDALGDFEAKNGIIVSRTKVRHELYYKFKESILNDH